MTLYKVVYNNCFGGFNLSMDAIKWLEKNSEDKSLIEHIEKCNCNMGHSALSYMYFMAEVSGWFSEKRHHKDLVAVVEALGDKASGDCSNLCIKKIYCNQYKIKEYDGCEEVITPNENWIVIST